MHGQKNITFLYVSYVVHVSEEQEQGPLLPPGPVTVKLPITHGTVPISRLMISRFFYRLRSVWLRKDCNRR